MNIERFLRDSGAYLRAASAAAPRREVDGHSRLWGHMQHTSVRTSQAVQYGTSVASLWSTSGRNARGTSWPA
jgi:hypothetical protein